MCGKDDDKRCNLEVSCFQMVGSSENVRITPKKRILSRRFRSPEFEFPFLAISPFLTNPNAYIQGQTEKPETAGC